MTKRNMKGHNTKSLIGFFRFSFVKTQNSNLVIQNCMKTNADHADLSFEFLRMLKRKSPL